MPRWRTDSVSRLLWPAGVSLSRGRNWLASLTDNCSVMEDLEGELCWGLSLEVTLQSTILQISLEGLLEATLAVSLEV